MTQTRTMGCASGGCYLLKCCESMVATIRIAGSCAEKAGATVLDDQHWPSALTAFVHAPIVEEKRVIVRWYCGHAPVVAVAAPHMPRYSPCCIFVRECMKMSAVRDPKILIFQVDVEQWCRGTLVNVCAIDCAGTLHTNCPAKSLASP